MPSYKDASISSQSSSSNRYPANERFDRHSPPSGPVRMGGGIAGGGGRSLSGGHSSVRDNEYAWMGGSNSGGTEGGIDSQARNHNHHQEERKSDPMSDQSQRQMSFSSDSEPFGGRKLGNRLSEPARGGDHEPFFDSNNQQEGDHLSSKYSYPSEQDLLLGNGVATGREASAMLDAARLSQSRRR